MEGSVVIAVERFLVSSDTRDEWLEVRKRGVTATQVAKAATPAGFKEVLASVRSGESVEPNAYMQWGVDREAYIAHYVKERFGVMPNSWLICAEGLGNEWMMATPDGLSGDHKIIGEYKTSGKSLSRIPLNYMRQIQFQLMVTGAEQCVFAWEQRLEGPYGFVPGLEIETQVVDRDEKMIKSLIEVAERLQQEFVFDSWVD